MVLDFELFKKLFADLTVRQEGFIEEKMQGLKEDEAISMIESTTQMFLEVAERWNKEPNNLLDGNTPEQVINGMDEQQFAEFLRAFFVSEATSVGEIYADLFKKYTDCLYKVTDELFAQKLKAIEDGTDAEKFDYANFETAMEILIALFEYDKTRYLDDIIKSFECVEADEQVWKAEMYMDMIFMHGEFAIPSVKAQLADKIAFSYSDEYLMAVIGRLGGNAEQKDNDLYRILRTFFKATSSKGYAALCIGDFGDPRGITLLRTYLENNISVMEEEDARDMLAAIQQLGGDISDFME